MTADIPEVQEWWWWCLVKQITTCGLQNLLYMSFHVQTHRPSLI
jgi:hypothetical protein